MQKKLLVILVFVCVSVNFLLLSWVTVSSPATTDEDTWPGRSKDIQGSAGNLASGRYFRKPRQQLLKLKPKKDKTSEYYRIRYKQRIHSSNLTKDDITVCRKMDSQVFGFPFLYKIIKEYGNSLRRTDRPELLLDVTLVTQLSCNRIEMMVGLLKQWNGPVSVAVYCKRRQDINAFIRTVKHQALRKNYYVILTMVFDPESSMDDNSKRTSLYPVNYLRNIALNNAVTDYVFLCDGDFMPSFGLHDYLIKAAESLLRQSLTAEYRALVVAAFEENKKMTYFPQNKAELKYFYDTGIVSYFHKTFVGHRQTNYKKWFQSESPYVVDWARDYEPYIVVRRKAIPNYDESFIGYGFNKIVHIAELQAMKFKFIVLPHEFIIHRIHPFTNDKRLIDTKGHIRNCIKHKYVVFLWNYLPMKYGLGWEDFKTERTEHHYTRGLDHP